MVEVFDLAVIGGGISGCGIARGAAGRGASVYLCEMNDLASGASSYSTKLIHGGLSYLENFEFRLVHEALAERETLWRIAPHIVQPIRFVLPYHHAHRPAWLMRFGLFLYDYTGGRRLLPPTKTLDLETDEAGRGLLPERFYYGFEFSDCRVDDSRLVVLNALDAARRGAVIETRTAAVAAERLPEGWRLHVENRETGVQREIHASALVNAAGPWVASTLTDILRTKKNVPIRLMKGSHVIVHRLYEHDRAYMLQNHDNRVVFVLPFERDFTLIGATEHNYNGDPCAAEPSHDEINYLLDTASDYFAEPVGRRDVVSTFAGVRPYYTNGLGNPYSGTRDYVLDTDNPAGLPPLITVYGANISTYRRLAETAMWQLAGDVRVLRGRGNWTGDAALPGGDMAVDGLPAYTNRLRHEYPFLDGHTVERLARTYGTLARAFLGKATRSEDLGRQFGHGLTEAELRYLMEHEWARDVKDVLWRRTKLGLRMDAEQSARIAAFMASVLGQSCADEAEVATDHDSAPAADVPIPSGDMQTVSAPIGDETDAPLHEDAALPDQPVEPHQPGTEPEAPATEQPSALEGRMVANVSSLRKANKNKGAHKGKKKGGK